MPPRDAMSSLSLSILVSSGFQRDVLVPWFLLAPYSGLSRCLCFAPTDHSLGALSQSPERGALSQSPEKGDLGSPLLSLQSPFCSPLLPPTIPWAPEGAGFHSGHVLLYSSNSKLHGYTVIRLELHEAQSLRSTPDKLKC